MSVLRYATPDRPRPTLDNGGLVKLDDGASPRIDRARSGISFIPLTEAIRPFMGMRNLEVRAKPGSKPRAMTVVSKKNRAAGKSTHRNPDNGGVQAPISEVPSCSLPDREGRS